MMWPPEKSIRLPDGSWQCVDCRIRVSTAHDFNLHNCGLGMRLMGATKPTQIVPKPAPKRSVMMHDFI